MEGAPIHVLGVGMLAFGKYPDRGIKQLAGDVLRAVLADAGLEGGELDAVWFANSGWGANGGQDSIRGQVALRTAGVEGIPILNVENACAGGSTALHGACLGVASGAYDVALAIGVEKVFQADRLRMFATFLGALDVEALPELIEEAHRRSAGHPPPDAPAPPGAGSRPARARAQARRGLGARARALATLAKDAVVIADHYRLDVPALVRDAIRRGLRAPRGGGLDHSPFMDVYAIAAREHIHRHGSTPRQLAIIAAKNHLHGARNPLAQIQREMSADEVLADRLVSWPLTRSMCAPIGDGAAAAIVCSERYLRGVSAARAVRVRASVVASGRAAGPRGDGGIAERASRQAYDAAGLGPAAIDLAEVHDATAFGELHQAEALGFCAPGEGGALAESGATAIGGRIPLNPSGGLECRGHPIGASGLAQVYEVVTQLRGEGGARQIDGARIGLTQNGGGMLGHEEAALAVHVFEAPARRGS